MLCAARLASLAAVQPSSVETVGETADSDQSSEVADQDREEEKEEEQEEEQEEDHGGAVGAGGVSTEDHHDIVDGAAVEDVPQGERSVGTVMRASAHSQGHTRAIDSIGKWIEAALATLDKTKDELVLPTLAPNNALVSDVLDKLTEWYVAAKTARVVGVDAAEFLLDRHPPRDNQLKAKSWLRRYINEHERRVAARTPQLPQNWSTELANSRGNARTVSKVAMRRSAANGTLYRHKHDTAPSHEQLRAMTGVGITGDARVHCNILDAVETGMAIALFLSTGARGAELKGMYLQSLGYEEIPCETAGVLFPCIKITAFETKTKEQHLNQIVAHSDPGRCGIGLLGLSVLIRNLQYGPPPFVMQKTSESWRIVGSMPETMDRRIKEAFSIAGVRRQSGDPVTYLGRHFGTRLLQHQGGSAEGGAARRGHGDGRTSGFHYTECPLPDLLRLAGNNPANSFVPAHLQPELWIAADKVLAHLFPELLAHRTALERRQVQVDQMPNRKRDKIRTEEQLNDQERLVRALLYASRTALCCLVARPRTWKRWTILVSASTPWQRSDEIGQRVIRFLFGQKPDAISAMNDLASAVKVCEDAELAARATVVENGATEVITGMIRTAEEKARRREARQDERQTLMLERLLGAIAPERMERPLVVPSPERGDVDAVADSTLADDTALCPLAGVRVKHARTHQEDVVYFSSWKSMSDALAYAIRELVPREKEEGNRWRIVKRADQREDKSRDKQWRNYRTLAIAVGLRMQSSSTWDDNSKASALCAIQQQFESSGHTTLLRDLGLEHRAITDADALAKRVLQL